MCYTRRDHDLEQEARKPRSEEEARRKREDQRRPSEQKEHKPVTEKVKEMVGVGG